MKFWDSSAVVPLLVAEPMTEVMERVLRHDPVMLVWWATEVECSSALCRLERDGTLRSSVLTSALEQLSALRGAWHEVMPVESVRRAARRCCGPTPCEQPTPCS